MAKSKNSKSKPQEPKAPKRPITVDAMKVFSAARTADGFDNFVSRLGLNNDNALSAGTYEFNLVTRNRLILEAAYRGSWVVGAIIDSIAEDMTRAGVDVTTNEDKSDMKDLRNAMSRLQIGQSLCSLVKWGGLYGGALGIIQIQGQSLETPLNLDTIAKDQFQGIVVYDRWMLYPDLTNIIDSGPDMGLPKYYYIVTSLNTFNAAAPPMKDIGNVSHQGQVKVHHSRCIRNIGIELPYFQAITEQMWGESKLERLWDRLISFDNATMSSASLIDRANLRTVGVEGLREIIAAGGAAQAGLVSMFEMMRAMQVNEGLTLIDKEDVFATTAYSFAGLSDMMLQFGQQISGACGIPLVRLFGQSPAGLSATGEADLRMYYDNINAQQNAKLRNGWELILKVMWRSVFGKESPKDMEFSFVPLWQTSAVDKAAISKSNTETIVGAFEAGLVSRPTAMKELRESSGDTGMFSNITDEEIKEAEEEPVPLPGEDDPEETDLTKPDNKEDPKEPVKNKDAKPKIKWWQRR